MRVTGRAHRQGMIPPTEDGPATLSSGAGNCSRSASAFSRGSSTTCAEKSASSGPKAGSSMRGRPRYSPYTFPM